MNNNDALSDAAAWVTAEARKAHIEKALRRFAHAVNSQSNLRQFGSLRGAVHGLFVAELHLAPVCHEMFYALTPAEYSALLDRAVAL